MGEPKRVPNDKWSDNKLREVRMGQCVIGNFRPINMSVIKGCVGTVFFKFKLNTQEVQPTPINFEVHLNLAIQNKI